MYGLHPNSRKISGIKRVLCYLTESNNLNPKELKKKSCFVIAFIAMMMLATASHAGVAVDGTKYYAKTNSAVKKRNKHYANACELLSKKRADGAKASRKPRRKYSKWR